jgi:hypothetical protein
MDDLVHTLTALAETDDPGANWELANDGVVISVKARSKAIFNQPGAAYDEALQMARELVGDTYSVVNRASIGAVTEPARDDLQSWRGSVELLLWPRRELRDDSHTVIELDT